MALTDAERSTVINTIDRLVGELTTARRALDGTKNRDAEMADGRQYSGFLQVMWDEFAANRLRDAEARLKEELVATCKEVWWGFDGEPLVRF